MNLTAIVTCKDRDNLSFCIESMRACRPRPYCIIVDFGSKIPINYGNSNWITVVRVDRNTEMFHKARAINIGIKSCKTKFLCIVDCDEIFQPNFFGVVRHTLMTNSRAFVMCKTYSLLKTPASFDFDQVGRYYNRLLVEAKNSGVVLHGDGCCNGVSTKWAMDVHGYDETFVGYRAQDSDFAFRAFIGGLQKTWMDNQTSMIHLPHDRIGEYYSGNYIVYNKKKYKQKTKLDPEKIIIANKSGNWGVI